MASKSSLVHNRNYETDTTKVKDTDTTTLKKNTKIHVAVKCGPWRHVASQGTPIRLYPMS